MNHNALVLKRPMHGNLPRLPAAIAVTFLVLGTHPGAIIDFYRERLSPIMFALWLAGFTAATLSPPVFAIIFWGAARRVRHGWLLHLLFVPALFAIVRGCEALMLFAANEPDMDGPSGWAIDPAIFLLVLAPVAYFVALGVANVGKLHRSAKDS